MTPVELLRRLIRFDTTNPPGGEGDCIDFLRGLIEDAGCETEVYAKEPGRPNLVTRLPGSGSGRPLLLYGHVDVVTTAGQRWQQPPFGGELVDGYVWGRGALDMKGGVAMLVSAFLRAKSEGLRPRGDLILAVLSDEEAGGDAGARFLVEDHPHLFEGVRHALGEFGGFSYEVGGKRFYPIQIAEKQICWLKATIRGPGGHGALVNRGGTMARLSRFLDDLDRKPLPVHVTPVARAFLERVAAELPTAQRVGVTALLKPRLAGRALRLLGARARRFEPMLRNTVSATIVRGGDKINVVPSEIELELDGRALPGFGPADLIAELQDVVGDDVQIELVRHDPGASEPDLTLFETLADILRELDPEGIPVPLLQVGVTDGRFFARLGIQTYGFLPMRLAPDFDFLSLIHAADERMPVEALEFGTDAIFRALQRIA
ncbi:MAG TPA: M20/M25/M40 family metallo-hydrolase [Actinomycetota bacterium]|nr:M20/M25/M40 family metallo-hydrolase [Actinomycetota bacterium]